MLCFLCHPLKQYSYSASQLCALLASVVPFARAHGEILRSLDTEASAILGFRCVRRQDSLVEAGFGVDQSRPRRRLPALLQ